MSRTRRASPEQGARDTIAREIPEMIDRLSARAGPAIDAEPVSDATLLRDWGQRDPRISDPDGLREQLVTTGLAEQPDLLDPQNPQALAMLRANPDIAQEWAQLLSEPMDEQMADLVVPLLEHPLRLGHLRRFEDDPEGGVRFSDSMDARHQRAMLRLLEQAPDALARTV